VRCTGHLSAISRSLCSWSVDNLPVKEICLSIRSRVRGWVFTLSAIRSVNFRMRQLHFYSFEWPSFSLCVHPNGNSCYMLPVPPRAARKDPDRHPYRRRLLARRFKLMWSYRYDLVQPRNVRWLL